MELSDYSIGHMKTISFSDKKLYMVMTKSARKQWFVMLTPRFYISPQILGLFLTQYADFQWEFVSQSDNVFFCKIRDATHDSKFTLEKH